MGCWNETCAVSRMKISSGEAVRFLPIVMNPYHVETIKGLPKEIGEQVSFKGQSGCYIGDLWTPLCYPIRGEYNDYGSIDNIPEKTHKDTAEYCQFTDAFKKHCLKIELGENEYHDVAIKDFTMSEILEALQEGRCFMNYESPIPNYPNRVVPIAWMMIKESVWQSLLSVDVTKSGEVWNSPGEDKYTLEGVRKSVTEMVERSSKLSRLKIETADTENDSQEETLRKAKEALELLRSTLEPRHFYRLRMWHNSPLDCPPINEDMIDVVTEMEYIHTMLSILRISFAPTTGSGSQCNNYKLWSLVLPKWKKLISDDLKKDAIEQREWNKKYKEILKKKKEEEKAKTKV